jgi:hypothetical protein
MCLLSIVVCVRELVPVKQSNQFVYGESESGKAQCTQEVPPPTPSLAGRTTAMHGNAGHPDMCPFQTSKTTSLEAGGMVGLFL